MAKTQNKTRQFEIPSDYIGAFFNELQETDLEYSLVEVDIENDELIVDVSYSSDQREEIMNLIELLDEYYSTEPDENDD